MNNMKAIYKYYNHIQLCELPNIWLPEFWFTNASL